MNASEICSQKCLWIPVIDGLEDADSAAIRIILADSQAVYRTGIWQILKAAPDIQVIAQVNSLAGLDGAVERCFKNLPTQKYAASKIILLEGNMISRAVDAISGMVRAQIRASHYHAKVTNELHNAKLRQIVRACICAVDIQWPVFIYFGNGS